MGGGVDAAARGGRRGGSRTARSAVLVGGALVLVVTVVACRPLPLGSATARLGNDVSTCPQFQPSPMCTPPGDPAGSGQPMTWMAATGPYEAYANGDPYATKCGPGVPGPFNETTCAGTNPLYRTTGSGYVMDVRPAQVGVPITLQVWDAGAFPRNGSQTKTNVTRPGPNQLLLPSGQTWTAGNDGVTSLVGRRVFGGSTQPTSIPPGTTITGVSQAGRLATLSQNTTATGTFSVAVGNNSGVVDCIATLPPFNTLPYNGDVSAQQCQTGDSGSAPLQVQVFLNDGIDDTIAFDTPLTGCELYVPQGGSEATYKNTWTNVCTFTPTMVGEYPVRIKSSGIVRPNGTVVPDAGNGYNAFSLRVNSGAAAASATHLYAAGDLSMWMNTPASVPRFYLTEITPADAGKRVQIDVFDPGDGTSGEHSVQILGPPSGAPRPIPNSGAVVPAAGLADSCRYNPEASATRGPDVQGKGGTDAADCRVITKYADEPSGRYNNGWLSIEIDLSPTYNCGAPANVVPTDCWWTVRYDFGGSGVATDRSVWSPIIIDRPATVFTPVGDPITGT
jgi:hypothetical protein